MRWALRRVVMPLAAALLVAGCSTAAEQDDAIERIDAPTSGVGDDGGAAEDSGDAVAVSDDEVETDPGVDDESPTVDPAGGEVDISVIPEDITLEYVDAVLVELERLYAE